MTNNLNPFLLRSELKISFILCIWFLTHLGEMKAQCGATEFQPSITCENAPLFCLQNWCTSTINNPASGWNGFCGPNTAVHNPQYYSFIPTSEEVVIDIHVDDCDNGNGLQAALISICPWEVGDVISCDPGTPPGGTMHLNANLLQIGVPIILLIDGSAGALCHYTITQTEGIYEIELTGELTGITGAPPSAVQGENITLEAVSTIIGAHGYYWVTGWNQDTITSTLPSINFDIPCDFDPGIFTICARAFSGCDTTDNEVCIDLEIFEAQDGIKEPSTFCLETFPFAWHALIIEGPGQYTQEFQASSGCPYDSIWQVDAYPESSVGLIDTNVCAFSFNYEGEPYYASGVYLLHYPGANINGCDSTAELHLTLDGIRYFIESVCTDTSLLLQPNIIEHSSPTDSIYFSWYRCEPDSFLSNTVDLVAGTSGCYMLILDHGFCHDTTSSYFQLESCDTPCSLVQETGCLDEQILFSFDGTMPADATLHWLIDQPGLPGSYFGESDSVFLSYPSAGCYRASLTIVDSTNSYTCVDSICILNPGSVASICCSETTCDTCTTLTIDMSGAAPWTLYIGGPEGIDTIAGIPSSSYVHTVCPPQDSLVYYTLTVTDAMNNCPAFMPGGNTISIQLNSRPEASIAQEVDTLCANVIENATYKWIDCQNTEVRSTSACFVPDTTGCYCVEITNEYGCSDTACYEFIFSSSENIKDYPISISPIPSRGEWNVQFPSTIVTPVHWNLMDLNGRLLDQGKLQDSAEKISLNKTVASGFYFLKFIAADGKAYSAKVIIQAD